MRRYSRFGRFAIGIVYVGFDGISSSGVFEVESI
jgi:hypothetical protein